MKVRTAIFASRFEMAGMYDSNNQLILAQGTGASVMYETYIERFSHTFGGLIRQMKPIYPGPEITESEDWKPISPIE